MKKLLFINIILLGCLVSFKFFDYGVPSKYALFANADLKLNIEKKKLAPPVFVPSDKVNYAKTYNDIINLIKINYVEDVEEEKFFEASLNGMLSSLDPHSAYFSKKEYNELLDDTQGNFSGLGIEITIENSLVKIISPIDDTPAYKAGIKAGDYISQINDKPVFGMTLLEAVGMMRGKDSKDRGIVKLTILREGEKEPLEFKIKRDLIKTESVRARAEGEIIYIRISSFTATTYTDFIKKFNEVENKIGKKNVKGLVLDLRNNPGGLLDSAIEISELFLNKGKKIVSIKAKENRLIREYFSEHNEDLIPNIPMVVLINEGSASASEIVSGALQDNNRAIILGTQSFGKGSVQSIIPLNNGGGIKLTIAKYYTPNDISIQAKGITPDVEVKLARIEEINTKGFINKEKELKGHLENNDVVSREFKKQLKTNNDEMYNKDYQLARAIDLLLGIDFYKNIKK